MNPVRNLIINLCGHKILQMQKLQETTNNYNS